jgi:iron(III) transport system ATP-binding protein
MSAIRIVNLQKTFLVGKDKVEALKNINLEVEEREFFVFLGSSGSGKSTLIRCIAGLEEPDDGEIWLGDELIFSKARSLSLDPAGRSIGMVFQSYAIWPHLTVFENVAFPLRVRRESAVTIRVRVGHALAMVGLAGMENRGATALSGGQQQRVALARALVYAPALLLLDEPLSNLDAKLREQMRLELRALQRKLNLTLLYVYLYIVV